MKVLLDVNLSPILTVLRDHSAALESGAILTVDETGSRVRILPLTERPASG